MTQQELFPIAPTRDPAAGEKARDEALERVEKNTPPGWLKEARRTVRVLAESGREFTSEDVTLLVSKPPEPRALGAVLREAQDEGLIFPTGRFVPAEDPSRHRAPIRVWRGRR